ncbi:LysE family transporter [Piscirickettsia litoralis]|uniref:LysE family transporter n=1 Tax=Piscirickettsia litoralis TaxID=1891921 RepID=UPI000981313A|nr:LysE family transporter [Piscirickettsia litoralis]
MKKSTLSVEENKHQPVQSQPVFMAFRDGLLTNVLNPKCTLFMLSIFTLVVKPHTSTYIQASYGLEIALVTTAWFVFLAMSLTYHRVKAKIEKVQHAVSKLIGAVLITLGLVVIFES